MYERMVKEVMQRELVTCLVTTPIDHVMRRLVEFGVHALVVVDEDGYAAGIVSQTDVLLAYRARPAGAAAPTRAGEIMSAALITCAPTATLLEAVTLMTRNHIHRLVVAKPDAGRVYPLGILSMTDIIRHLINEPAMPAIPRLQVATV
jgi:CBS domain-containing protein